MTGYRHLIVSSNPWFSAVTEYTLQFGLYLSSLSDLSESAKPPKMVIHCHPRSPGAFSSVEKALTKRALLGKATPNLIGDSIRAKGLSSTIGSVFKILGHLKTLIEESNASKEAGVVWVTCGHEHAVCAFYLQLMALFGRKNLVSLVRLRCQDQFKKQSSFMNRVLNRSAQFYAVPSQISAERLLEINPEAKVFVQPFCKDAIEKYEVGAKHSLFKKEFLPQTPAIDVHSQLLITVARFDPVKGLEELVSAFANEFTTELTNTDKLHSLIIIGRSENIQASALGALAKKKLGMGHSIGARHFARNPSGTKKIYILDEKVEDLPLLMQSCHMAVISSLGSEIVCRTAVEYMQSGLPVVSTDVGSLVEVLGDGCMSIAKTADEYGLRLALEESNARIQDSASRARYQKLALQQGQKFRLAGFGVLMACLESSVVQNKR